MPESARNSSAAAELPRPKTSRRPTDTLSRTNAASMARWCGSAVGSNSGSIRADSPKIIIAMKPSANTWITGAVDSDGSIWSPSIPSMPCRKSRTAPTTSQP